MAWRGIRVGLFLFFLFFSFFFLHTRRQQSILARVWDVVGAKSIHRLLS